MDRVAGRRTSHAELRIPNAANHVWLAFWQLEQGRQLAFEGQQPFSYVEIDAWCRLSGERLAPWELAAIMEMDIARRGALIDSSKANELQGPENMVHQRTVSFKNVKAVESLFDSFGTVVDC